jgi:hypothetical protein
MPVMIPDFMARHSPLPEYHKSWAKEQKHSQPAIIQVVILMRPKIKVLRVFGRSVS